MNLYFLWRFIIQMVLINRNMLFSRRIGLMVDDVRNLKVVVVFLDGVGR